jgi:hypothetical protein
MRSSTGSSQTTLPLPGDLQDTIPVDHLERPENPKFHRSLRIVSADRNDLSEDGRILPPDRPQRSVTDKEESHDPERSSPGPCPRGCGRGRDRCGTAVNGDANVDPLAVSYLAGHGLSPSEVKSRTQGDCSHQVKAASCYAMLDRSATSGASTRSARSVGFDWSDAGIGAAATFGLVLVLGGAGAGISSRRGHRRQMAGA